MDARFIQIRKALEHGLQLVNEAGYQVEALRPERGLVRVESEGGQKLPVPEAVVWRAISIPTVSSHFNSVVRRGGLTSIGAAAY